MVRLLRPAHRRSGMTSLQAVILLGAGFLVVWGLMDLFDGNKGTARENTALTLAGGFKRPQAGRGNDIRILPVDRDDDPRQAPGGGGLGDGGTGEPPPGLPDGVEVRGDGTFVSVPELADANGHGGGITAAEQSRNEDTIRAAVDASPFGVAVLGGWRANGGPGGWTDFRSAEMFDHVAVAVRVGEDIEIFEMLPNYDNGAIARNIGKPGGGPSDLPTFAGGYDSIHAVPVAGITAQQAALFVDALRTITAPGEVYGFLDGQTCATAVATAMNQAGIPNDLVLTTAGINDLLPSSVVQAFRDLRDSPLGRAQIAARR